MDGSKVALVTGASSGLGVALAERLASSGYDLILTARRRDALEETAKRLRSRGTVRVAIETSDLGAADGAAALVASLDAKGLRPNVLVNNAGAALNESLVSHTSAALAAMLQLNIVSLSELTRVYADRMRQEGGGHILLVASMAAYMPAPMLAAYAASKAYVLSFGEALHVELAPTVGVTVLSPGYMETGFDAASGFVPSAGTRKTAMAPAQVAAIGLDALFAGKSSVVAGGANRAGAALSRLLPRSFLARQVLRSMGDRFTTG